MNKNLKELDIDNKDKSEKNKNLVEEDFEENFDDEDEENVVNNKPSMDEFNKFEHLQPSYDELDGEILMLEKKIRD